jgi:hypothetical protein
MCTVAFLPTEGGGFLLGHNRDESRRRTRGLRPRRRTRGGRAWIAPQDPDGGGTWLAANDSGLVCCMLNAVHIEPARLPADPPSRGKLLWRLAHLDRLDGFVEAMKRPNPPMESLRGFHLVVAEPERGGRPARVSRFRWDGREAGWEHRTGPAVFVSSGYDPRGAEVARLESWRSFLARGSGLDRSALAGWLASHEPVRGPDSVCMHRPEASTVSRTLVEVLEHRVLVEYVDGPPCEPSSPVIHRSLGRIHVAAPSPPARGVRGAP